MFGWQVSNSTCMKYGQTSLLISRVCWMWCQSHILVTSLLQPTTTTPTTSPTTSTHRPTTIHVRFATMSTPCNATWSPLSDRTPAIQQRQQPPNKIPWPHNNGNRDTWSTQQPQTTAYWYECGMVWVLHSMVWWYWYGAHIPLLEWVPSRCPKSRNWCTS